MRVLVALLMSISMLHLSLVGGDLACATHGSSGAHASSGAHEMAGMPMHADAAEAAAPDAPADCATPIQPGCCDVMVGCSVIATLDVVPPGAMEADPTAAVPQRAAIRPASILPAPEPPPPKA
jgi:hypothetical protein